MTGLFPGYKQVENFSEELKDDFEEETVYITMDLGNADPTVLANATSYRLIGLDTPSPFLQIGGSVYQGSYEELLGTEILLKDSVDGKSRRQITPFAVSSERRVRFHQVTLNKKEDEELASDDSDEQLSLPARSRANAALLANGRGEFRRRGRPPRNRGGKGRGAKE